MSDGGVFEGAEGSEGSEGSEDITGSEDLGGEGDAPETSGEEGGAPETSEEGSEDSSEGEGEAPVKPEWVEDKFWNEESGEVDVEKMQSSYSELQKAFSQKKGTKAPDKYELELPEGLELGPEVMDVMKQSNLSNDAAQNVVNTFYDIAAKELQAANTEILGLQIRNMKGLGVDEDGDASYTDYIKQLRDFAVGRYGEEEAKRRATTLDGVRELDMLMSAEVGGGQLPFGSAGITNGAVTIDDLAKLRENPNYGLDNAEGHRLQKLALEISRKLNAQKK
jgi:soluble cytochrome b562